jgi:hypothetical protein
MKQTLYILLLILISGCSKESSSPYGTIQDIKGKWSGSTDSLKLEVTILTENLDNGLINGYGFMNDTTRIDPIYGSYIAQNVCFRFLSPSSICNFSGKLNAGKIEGTCTYGEYFGKPITLEHITTGISK